MTKGLCTLLVAGSLTVPHITAALGNDATVGLGSQGAHRSQAEIWGALPLPPVPHLETMPWLTSRSFLKGPKVDLLLGPNIENLAPFLVAPAITPQQSDRSNSAG